MTPEQKQSDAEFLRTMQPLPLSLNGYVAQPGRKYIELAEEDVVRLAAIADRLEKLEAENAKLREACEEAQHVWEQGCVDRGYGDERNWIDEAKDLIDAALTSEEPRSC